MTVKVADEKVNGSRSAAGGCTGETSCSTLDKMSRLRIRDERAHLSASGLSLRVIELIARLRSHVSVEALAQKRGRLSRCEISTTERVRIIKEKSNSLG